ncbi:MAG: serine/threonine protein kinase [Ahniella sp.]|nr:serine/threonine protein kinase [Ahniella sp.]
MHTDEPDPLLLKVAEDIADGLPVDWSSLAQQVEPNALRRMRELAELAGHFSVAQQVAAGEQPAADTASPRGAATESAPKQFAHLQILDELGRGSSGVVYRAFDPLLRRTVALKLCNPQGDMADDLLREAQQMARIDHPGVLKIHGAQIVDGHVGFWSDLVDGESIAHRLLTQRIIPAHESVLIALELCAALAAIHHIGLVHGDVKAQNVVRDHDGQHVLIDFGSARTLQERTHVSGTPLYLAPELLNGGQNTSADDLYSLGVLVFRMLSGRYPVEAESLAGLVEAHAEGRRLHLLDMQPHIDASLADVIERAVHPERSRRFQRAGEFAAALRQCLPGPAGMAATQRLDGTTERRPARLPSANRAWIGAGLGALLLAVLWFVWPNPARATHRCPGATAANHRWHRVSTA